jgi:hypothetical protein
VIISRLLYPAGAHSPKLRAFIDFAVPNYASGWKRSRGY